MNRIGSDELGVQLHDRATRGRTLSAEEQAQLEEWYAEKDCAEMAMLSLSWTVRTKTFFYDLTLSPRPKFAHGVEYEINSKLTLTGTFHPSQQNTFTGRLTEAMFDRIFPRVRELLLQN